MIRLALGAAALLLLAACETPGDPTYRDLDQMGRNYQRDNASATPQNQEEATAADSCHASQFRRLVGGSVSAIDRSTLPAGARIISPGMMVTQDFRPDRLNIRVGPDEKVTAVQCF